MAENIFDQFDTPVEVTGRPIFAEDPRASSVAVPKGFKLLPIELADARPQGTFYDQRLNAFFTPISPPAKVQTELQARQPVAQVQVGAEQNVFDQFDAPATPVEEKPAGFIAGLVESVTGEKRSASPEVAKALKEGRTIYAMPETNQMSFGLVKSAFGGLLANPEEKAKIFVANFPGLTYRKDELGTVFLTSPTDGKEYVIEPGLTPRDIPAVVGGVAAFTPAGRAATIPSAMVRSGLTQTAIEAGESAAGGEFNTLPVALATTLGPVPQILGKVMPPVVEAVKQGSKAVVEGVTQAVTQPITTAKQLLTGIEKTFTEPITTAKKAANVVEQVVLDSNPQKKKEIVDALIADPTNTSVVNYRLVNNQPVIDVPINEALKQGWKDGTLASIKAGSPKDRQAMSKMLNIFKMGEKSERFRATTRPADILGDTVQSRISFLTKANKEASTKINEVANTQLRGQRVNFDPAINTFIKDLESLGVKVEIDANGVAKAVLQGSDIQGDKQAQRVLNAVLERLSTSKPPDAYGVHTAKRFIDTQVDYGKRNTSNPLTSQAERTLKTLRRNLNKSLGDTFPEYKAANTKYSDTVTSLDSMQKAAGTQINFDSANADKALGTAMRKLTSNYGTRANLIDALDLANQTATKYGMKIEDDVINQLIFVNELDRMFGAQAQTSLKGQVAEAMETGVDIARGGGASRAFELLAEKAENLRGINKENAVKAMEELLKRK